MLHTSQKQPASEDLNRCCRPISYEIWTRATTKKTWPLATRSACRRSAKRRPHQFFIIVTIINLRPFSDYRTVCCHLVLSYVQLLYTVAAHRFTTSAIMDVYRRKRSALSAYSRHSGGLIRPSPCDAMARPGPTKRAAGQYKVEAA